MMQTRTSFLQPTRRTTLRRQNVVHQLAGLLQNEGEDELLTQLVLDFPKDDKVSRPISQQLAEIINKRWARTRSKKMVDKYDRPEN